MGRARRTERGEEGRESRKRLEKERETETERERREEKTEVTTVGKIRKWQEMGSCEQGADWLPNSPPATAPTSLQNWASIPCLHAPGRGNHRRDHSRRGEHCQRGRSLQAGKRKWGKLGHGRYVLGSQRTLKAPPPPRPDTPDSAWRPTPGRQIGQEAGAEWPILTTGVS